MIIWINGPFGVGKTTVATLLYQKIEDSLLYDPELFGDFLQQCSSKYNCLTDFQDYPIWRQLTYQTIHDLARNTDKVIIVPMTIYRKKYEQEIIQQLKTDGFDLKHYTLIAKKEIILKRLELRTEEDNIWAKEHLDTCLTSFEKQSIGKQIDANHCSPVELVKHIIQDCQLHLVR